MLVAVEEVDGADLVVHELAYRVAMLDATAVLFDLSFLLGKGREGHPEAAETAVCRVQLGAWTGHRHPHRRGGVLLRFWGARPRRGREKMPRRAEALLFS